MKTLYLYAVDIMPVNFSNHAGTTCLYCIAESRKVALEIAIKGYGADPSIVDGVQVNPNNREQQYLLDTYPHRGYLVYWMLDSVVAIMERPFYRYYTRGEKIDMLLVQEGNK